MKKSFLTGLVILLPLVVTILLFIFLLDLFSSPFLETVSNFLTKHIPHLNSEIITFISRIIILVLFCSFIILLGAIGQKFVIKTIINWGNSLLMKIPFIKSIHHTIKDLIEAIISIDERKAFVHPLMINFPSKQSFSLGFLSGTVPKECERALNKKLVSVLMPTAPHPIAGYLVFVPQDEAYKINLTNEDIIKFVLSCGVITPENQNEPKGSPNEQTTT